MDNDKKPAVSENRSIFIDGDVTGENVIIGDNNSINQTIIQKFYNIYKSDSETLEHRNRRILLGHVENAWIKGVLDASLHGAALLDLGIKQDPEAVTKYPWAIKKESTDETLPAGISMLEIFDSIGMGRSLLILGAPGSGKTTMLLELARGLIARAREDVTQPIPMVFNLASWTEKLSLADWLTQELNNLYSVPRKTAPDWVKGDKLLLLLDGLDEVRQESRAKCVEAINTFRKAHGLTSLAVCSRSQDYADLNAKLSFEGAIEVQPLTQKQITEFFNRFQEQMAGIKQALEKDSALREMAETPLFLSIMTLAYRDTKSTNISVSDNLDMQRKNLFNTYIDRMFERPERSKNKRFKMQDALCWLAWLAQKMIEYNQTPYSFQNMQPKWLSQKSRRSYNLIGELIVGPLFGLIVGLFGYLFGKVFGAPFIGAIIGLSGGLSGALNNWLGGWHDYGSDAIIDTSERDKKPPGIFRIFALILGILIFLFPGLIASLTIGLIVGLVGGLMVGLNTNLNIGLNAGLSIGLNTGLNVLVGMLIAGLFQGLLFEVYDVIKHQALHFVIARDHHLPWKLVPFLDHCVDLIFLRRVGGGYIFVHRLLMEHFAEMYVETPTAKGN